jgi:hypothetical protein
VHSVFTPVFASQIPHDWHRRLFTTLLTIYTERAKYSFILITGCYVILGILEVDWNVNKVYIGRVKNGGNVLNNGALQGDVNKVYMCKLCLPFSEG